LIERGTLRGFPTPPATGSGEQSSPAPTRSAPRLYIVTDRTATGGRPLVEIVARALEGIADSGLDPREVAVQLREKDLEGRALTELARALRAVTGKAGVRLYVNDRIDVAMAVDADGIHLPGTSLSPAEAQALAPSMAIGVSAHGTSEVRAAAGAATFAVFGPIRDTPSKRRYGAPLGFESLAAAAQAGLPLLAIGGVDATDVPAAVAAGARGIACIRPVMAAPDPAAAVQALGRALASSPVASPYRT
jgi:thiamine-phosphate pyrophosphorylase